MFSVYPWNLNNICLLLRKTKATVEYQNVWKLDKTIWPCKYSTFSLKTLSNILGWLFFNAWHFDTSQIVTNSKNKNSLICRVCFSMFNTMIDNRLYSFPKILDTESQVRMYCNGYNKKLFDNCLYIKWK